MTSVSNPIFGIHSNTQRQLEAYQFATQPGYTVAKVPHSRTITISGLVARDDAQKTVETAFGAHFAANDMQVSITPNENTALPVHFHVALRGNAYNDIDAGEAAQREMEESGTKPRFVRDVMAKRAYEAINTPQFTVSEFPGLHDGTVTISGPVLGRARSGMQAYLGEYFGNDGVRVTQEDGRFSATLTGAAYATYMAGQALHEASNPVAIGH